MSAAFVVIQHRHRGERPFQQFSACSKCQRVRDDADRPLWVTGRRRAQLVCIDCFAGASTVRRKRAA